jgi:hypothetical protein
MFSWNIQSFDYRLMKMERINKVIGDIVTKLNQIALSKIEIFFRKWGKASMILVIIYLFILQTVIKPPNWCGSTYMVVSSECMGKTFQAATTNTWELFDHRSLLQNIFLISAKLNFHRPLVCSTICHVQYYTPEVGGSSVWQISKKYFAGVIYGQKAPMC